MIRSLTRGPALSISLFVVAGCDQAAPPVAPTAGAPEPVEAAQAQQAQAPTVEEVLLTVGPEKVPCTGVAPQTCLRVRTTPGGDWELFYDAIEGFDHEPGVETSLIARRERIEHPPADASAHRWTLVQVIGRRPLVVPP
ncbi:MAG: DUF4377 domain-containing protein [Panacagrimonas sp.]